MEPLVIPLVAAVPYVPILGRDHIMQAYPNHIFNLKVVHDLNIHVVDEYSHMFMDRRSELWLPGYYKPEYYPEALNVRSSWPYIKTMLEYVISHPNLTDVVMRESEYGRINDLLARYPGAFLPWETHVMAMKYLYQDIRNRFLASDMATINELMNENVASQSAVMLEDLKSKRERYINGQRSNLFYFLWDVLKCDLTSVYRAIGQMQQVNRGKTKKPEDIQSAVANYSEAYKNVQQQIEASGYEFHYFIFINKTHPLRLMFTGQTPLSSDIFELGALHLNEYEVGGNFKLRIEPDRSRGSPSGLGWRLKDVHKAVLDSDLEFEQYQKTVSTWDDELQDDVVTVVNAIPQHKVYRYPTADKDYRGKLLIAELHFFTKTLKYNWSRSLESLYRIAYGTMRTINWSLVCEKRLLSLESIRIAAVTYLKLEEAYNKNYTKVCAMIRDAVASRNNVASSLVRELPFRARALKFQLGTPWIIPRSRYQFSGADAVNPMFEDPTTRYNELLRLCQSSDVGKEEFLTILSVNNLRYMLPENLDTYTKDDICEHLLYMSKLNRDRYGPVVEACANESVTKGDILDAIAMMDLGDLLKNVKLETVTKEGLCKIISDYIKLLRDKAGLTVAPGQSRFRNYEKQRSSDDEEYSVASQESSPLAVFGNFRTSNY